MKIVTILIISILLVGTFTTVPAQELLIDRFGGSITTTPQPILSQSEKKAFYRLILRNYFHYARRNTNPTEVKLVMGSVPAELLPRLEGVKFVLISREEVVRLRHQDGGIEYYDISGPNHREGRWSFWIRNARASGCDSQDWMDKFEFRMVASKWKFQRSFGGVDIGHCATRPEPPPPAKLPLSPR